MGKISLKSFEECTEEPILGNIQFVLGRSTSHQLHFSPFKMPLIYIGSSEHSPRHSSEILDSTRHSSDKILIQFCLNQVIYNITENLALSI